MIDNGTYSKLAASIAMNGFRTTIKTATAINELSDAVEANATLIEATVEGTVDYIVFPPVGVAPASTLVSADQGNLEVPVDLDASVVNDD